MIKKLYKHTVSRIPYPVYRISYSEKKGRNTGYRTLKHILFILSIMFLTSACSIYVLDSEETSTNYYPSKKSTEEVVYLKSVDQPHEIIGLVKVNVERSQHINDVIEKMKRQAALIGGDAITNIQSDASGTWKKLPLQQVIGNAYVRANFTASVVVFGESLE